MCGDTYEAVGHMMYECGRLSELQRQMLGESWFYKIWLASIVNMGCLVVLKGF